mmetsp:Transcript_5968/g.7511  ORF Transcript_5968/g.7511 Transcript_5968/m.7511 type:complete len:250 (+) Transcript_5968:50-799(+)
MVMTYSLYGVPLSQPTRTVLWTLLMKQLPFGLCLINPGTAGKKGSKNPEYLRKNPAGTIPMLEDKDNDFTLAEANAILMYLASKHSWTDLYPDDLQKRAKVDWYLNYHHRSIRELTAGIVMPKFRKDISLPPDCLTRSKRIGTAAVQVLNDGWLSETNFLTGDSFTLADLVAYSDIGQMKFLNLYDFSHAPKVQSWLDRMKELPFHNEIHLPLEMLGDISKEPPSMEQLKFANKTTLQVLENIGTVKII